MLEIIGIGFTCIIGWVLIKMVLVRIFPEYGLREAEARYERSPDDVNERLLWEARTRLSEKEEKDRTKRK
ncbi:hypothetical protein [Acinetobacter gandensis]|jgi:hypothetical protein|uniref:hypothetical protein n=1 Tax=Acinetobacter gandensis TaxID=1443941 RepID=UPI003F55C270